MPQGHTLQSIAKVVVFRAIASSDHSTPSTGKTIAITISKNGGVFGNPNAGATNATEISSGFYKFTLDTTDTNTVGPLAWRGAVSGVDDAGDVYDVVKATNGGFTALPDAAAEAAGGLYTRGTGAGQIAQDANGNVRVNVDTIKTQAVTLSGGVTIPAATLASTTNITAGTITTTTNLTTNNDKTGYALSAAGVTAVWAEVMDGTRTAVQAMRGFIAALLGKASGLDTNAPKYRDIADSKNVIDATTDANGNRTAVTLDLT